MLFGNQPGRLWNIKQAPSIGATRIRVCVWVFLVCHIHIHKHTRTCRNVHECRGTEKVDFWVRVSLGINIIPLCKYSPANRVGDGFVCVCVCVCAHACAVSFCLASSRYKLAGEASRLYLFINLLGTGNERDKVNTLLHTGRQAFSPPIEWLHIQ